MNPFFALSAREQQGSRARCLLLSDGVNHDVADRITQLTDGHAVVDPDRHTWAPRGLQDRVEPELGKTPPFLSAEQRSVVLHWWLAVQPDTARTPNWDVVSQATIAGREGLILVEAKAHAAELDGEAGRKRLDGKASQDSLKNHQRIGECIDKANASLRTATSLPWMLSRDIRYQMSNRFAWAWKVAHFGVPVILIYLGFLGAGEMPSTISDHEEWEKLVKTHGKAIVPREVWGRVHNLNGTPMIPLIRSMTLSLPTTGEGTLT